jgi:hypothetical protein
MTSSYTIPKFLSSEIKSDPNVTLKFRHNGRQQELEEGIFKGDAFIVADH